MSTTRMSTQPVVMVTGATGELGSELVRVFSEDGYQVFATARTLPEKSDAKIVWHQLDVTSDAQCREAMKAGFDQFGHIDILINNASGYTGGKTIAEMSESDIDTELAVTLRAPIYLSKLFVERARSQRSGKAIFIASVAGLFREPNCELYSVYAAAKAGLIRFAECLHEDIQPLGMQAHVVVPGSMRSGLNETELLAQGAISYDAVARHILDVARSDGTSHLCTSILRPASVQSGKPGDHRDFPTLETERLLLRIPNAGDATGIVSFYTNNSSYLGRYSPAVNEGYLDKDFWIKRIEEMRKDFTEDKACNLIIIGKNNGEIFGFINFFNFIRAALQGCILGLGIAERAQRQGLMTEGLRAAINYVMRDLNLHRIEANYHPENIRSAKLLQKLGFVIEGTASHYLRIGNAWQPHVRASLTNHDWQTASQFAESTTWKTR